MKGAQELLNTEPADLIEMSKQDDPKNPPYGTNTWIEDLDPRLLQKYHDEYHQFVADLSKIATAGAAGAGYLAVQAAILWQSIEVFLGSLPVPVP